jgi:hypothetical protein
MRIIATAISTRDASATADFVIGSIAVLLGGLLALDVKKISTTLTANSTGFTPWGKRRGGPPRPDPLRIVGWMFLLAGVIVLIVGLVRV